MHEPWIYFLFLLLPAAGIVLCGLYCKYVVKDEMEFGCEKISDLLRLYHRSSSSSKSKSQPSVS